MSNLKFPFPVGYPWDDHQLENLPTALRVWLYLPDYAKELSPDVTLLVGKYYQYHEG